MAEKSRHLWAVPDLDPVNPINSGYRSGGIPKMNLLFEHDPEAYFHKMEIATEEHERKCSGVDYLPDQQNSLNLQGEL
jgi:hypothetical protein